MKMLTIENTTPKTILELLLKINYELETNQATLEEAKTEVQTIAEQVRQMVNDLDETVTQEVQESIENLLASGELNDVIAEVFNQEIVQDIQDDLTRIKNGIGNVKDYGAVGDGVTDDSQAFVRAIANHHHIYVPTGRYLIQKVYLHSSVIIEGETSQYAWREQEQQGSVIVVKQDASLDKGVGGFILNGWATTNQNSCTFRNLCFEAQVTGYGTAIWGRWDCTIDQCLFRNLAYGVRDYHASKIFNSTFEKCEFGLYGITDVMVNGCTFSVCNTAIYCYQNSGNYNLIIGSRIEYSVSVGVHLHQCVYNSIVGCQFDKNNLGLRLQNATETLVSGCHFDRNVTYHVTFEGVTGTNLTGCQFIKRSTSDGSGGTNAPEYAIKLVSYGSCVVSGCCANHKIFDKTYYQYKGGYLEVGGTGSPYYNDYKTSGEPEAL